MCGVKLLEMIVIEICVSGFFFFNTQAQGSWAK